MERIAGSGCRRRRCVRSAICLGDELQTRVFADGLESAEAKAFLEVLPTPEQLMPSTRIAPVWAWPETAIWEEGRRCLRRLYFVLSAANGRSRSHASVASSPTVLSPERT